MGICSSGGRRGCQKEKPLTNFSSLFFNSPFFFLQLLPIGFPTACWPFPPFVCTLVPDRRLCPSRQLAWAAALTNCHRGTSKPEMRWPCHLKLFVSPWSCALRSTPDTINESIHYIERRHGGYRCEALRDKKGNEKKKEQKPLGHN